MSFVVWVVIASAVLLLAALAALLVRMLRRLDAGEAVQAASGPTEQALRVASGSAAQAFRLASDSAQRAYAELRPRLRRPPVREPLQRLGVRMRTTANGAHRRSEVYLARGLRTYALTAYRLRSAAAQRLDGNRRRAIELNTIGAQLRRDGEPEQAAEQHQAALEIARELGDQHTEALTLNNLGLALAHGGAEAAALRHLEQARVVLRELGDDEHEGQVLANLGLVHRRQGHSEEAVSLFQEALSKLPPESIAYRHVAEELRRAS